MELSEWIESNPASDQMYWKGAAGNQAEAFMKLAVELDTPARVVGSHRSKSIDLPVVEFKGTHGRFLLRDNFHDWNLVVLWDFPVHIPLREVYQPLDWDWYVAEMGKVRNYTFRGWTDEEMDDPRILRVEVKSLRDTTYWSNVEPDRKDRWAKRMTDPEWFSRDWSSGKILVEGAMGPGCTLYRTGHCFAEGINKLVDRKALEPYEPGKTQFGFELGEEEVLPMMKRVNAARVPEKYPW